MTGIGKTSQLKLVDRRSAFSTPARIWSPS